MINDRRINLVNETNFPDDLAALLCSYVSIVDQFRYLWQGRDDDYASIGIFYKCEEDRRANEREQWAVHRRGLCTYCDLCRKTKREGKKR